MTFARILLYLVAACLLISAGTAEASSLSVSPTSIDVLAPQQAAALALRNGGDKPLNAQVRVFRWRQPGGEDVLEPAKAVVASPAIIEIKPGADYTIRIVRTSREPVKGEENYRVVVDELPDAAARRNGAIAVTLRFVVPASFFSPDATQGRLAWKIVGSGKDRYLSASNDGDRRVRLSDLKANGKPVAMGLAGYVLGHSEKRWKLPAALKGGSLRVSVMTDHGSITAPAAGK